MENNTLTPYNKLKQSVFDVMDDLGIVMVESEIDEIIGRLLRPCWHEAMGKGNGFIENAQIEAMFDCYDGTCAWVNGDAPFQEEWLHDEK